MLAERCTYMQPTAYERLETWSSDDLNAYLAELKAERQALWAEPVPPRRLSAVDQLIEDVHDVLWLRTCAAWRAEERAA